MDLPATILPSPALPPPAAPAAGAEASAPDASADFARTLENQVTRGSAQESAPTQDGSAASAQRERTPARGERARRFEPAPLGAAQDERMPHAESRKTATDAGERDGDARRAKRDPHTDAAMLAVAPAINAPLVPAQGDAARASDADAPALRHGMALGAPAAAHGGATTGGADGPAALRAPAERAPEGERAKTTAPPLDAPATLLHAVEQASAYISAASAAPHDAHEAQPAHVAVPLGAPGWDGALSREVVMLAKDGQHVAQLHLNPPDLGPLDVRVTVGAADGTASAHFASAHAAVREAVEAALPRLREAYAQNGLALGTVTVSTGFRDSAAQQQGSSSSPYARDAGDAPRAVAPASTMPAAGVRVRRGLVDTFA